MTRSPNSSFAISGRLPNRVAPPARDEREKENGRRAWWPPSDRLSRPSVEFRCDIVKGYHIIVFDRVGSDRGSTWRTCCDSHNIRTRALA
jgi:hypothetical protein